MKDNMMEMCEKDSAMSNPVANITSRDDEDVHAEYIGKGHEET